MSIKDLVRNELVTDTENILKDNIERVRDILNLHQDGTVDLQEEFSDLPHRERILAYFVGRKYSVEAELIEDEAIDNSFFYDIIPKDDSTIRRYLISLRDDRLIKKVGNSENRLVVENLPKALDRIKQAASGRVGIDSP